jgi:hypothetical protein
VKFGPVDEVKKVEYDTVFLSVGKVSWPGDKFKFIKSLL